MMEITENKFTEKLSQADVGDPNRAVARKEASKQLTVRHDPLRSALYSPGVKARFEEMLGKRAPSFMSSIISAVNANAQLKHCDPMSVIAAASIAASMELPINSSLGLAHIVPYKGKAQFQVGWKGFVQLALRSGQYKTIHLTPVFEGQIKAMNQFTGEIEFTHEAASDKHIGYLLYFKLLSGYEKYFYMNAHQVEAHARKYSASFKKGYGVWIDDFESMALKTVCKLGLSKYGILSLEMQRAIEVDQAEMVDHGELKYVDNPDVAVKEEGQDKVTKILDKYTPPQQQEVLESEITPGGCSYSDDDMPNPFEKDAK
jgi:recombination protein RecT